MFTREPIARGSMDAYGCACVRATLLFSRRTGPEDFLRGGGGGITPAYAGTPLGGGGTFIPGRNPGGAGMALSMYAGNWTAVGAAAGAVGALGVEAPAPAALLPAPVPAPAPAPLAAPRVDALAAAPLRGGGGGMTTPVPGAAVPAVSWGGAPRGRGGCAHATLVGTPLRSSEAYSALQASTAWAWVAYSTNAQDLSGMSLMLRISP